MKESIKETVTLPDGDLRELVEQYASLKPDLYIGNVGGRYWEPDNLVTCTWNDVREKLLHFGDSGLAFMFKLEDGVRINGSLTVRVDVTLAKAHRMSKVTVKETSNFACRMSQTEIIKALPFGVSTATKKVKAWITNLETGSTQHEQGNTYIEESVALEFISSEIASEVMRKAEELGQLEELQIEVKSRLDNFLQ